PVGGPSSDQDESHRHETRQGCGDERRPPELEEEHSGDVAADAVEDVVAEGYVPGVAAEDVPARSQSDPHECDRRQLQHVVVRAQEPGGGQRQGEEHDGTQHPPSARAGNSLFGGGGGGLVDSADVGHHALAFLPNRPSGLTISIKNRAPKNVIGAHTAPMWVLTNEEITAKPRAPTTAPLRLPMPPRTTSERRMAIHCQ